MLSAYERANERMNGMSEFESKQKKSRKMDALLALTHIHNTHIHEQTIKSHWKFATQLAHNNHHHCTAFILHIVFIFAITLATSKE